MEKVTGIDYEAECKRLEEENERLKEQQNKYLYRFERIRLDRLKENLKRKYDLENIYEQCDVFEGYIVLKLQFNKTYHKIGLRIPIEILENEIESFNMCDSLINREIMCRYLKE